MEMFLDMKSPEFGARDGYVEFEKAVANRVQVLVNNVETPVFCTNAEGLYELYLANIQEDHRQHYNCSACRHFIERFGALVLVNEAGKTESLMWKAEEVPAFFQASVKAMQEAVEAASITGVFLSGDKKLGTPKTGIWTHLHMTLPRGMVVATRAKNADQQMAQKRQDYKTMMAALQKYTFEAINTAIEDVLQSGAAYRADRVIERAKAFREVKEIFDARMASDVKRNLLWLQIAKKPEMYYNIGSSPVGELMDNIMAGVSMRASAVKFSERMDGYMVSTAAPTAGAVENAERKIAELGLTEALERKYEAYANIPKEAFVWENKAMAAEAAKAAAEKAKPAGIFANIVTKEKKNAVSVPGSDMPAMVMTWAKFAKTILPEACQIEAMTGNRNRFMALVTAANEDAENILQWNNPVSWYYAGGGIDVRMKQSIEAHGGQYENVQIRASLMWENENNFSSRGTDLDLHCVTPYGQHIYYGNKRDRTGGYLDVDANAAGTRTMDVPVENIRWTQGAANGHYKFYVNNYKQVDRRANAYKVELAIGNQIFAIEDVAGSTGMSKTAFEFDYCNGTVSNLKMFGHETVASAAWGVPMGEFVKVKGIVTSPNTWGGDVQGRYGTHMFFLLDGCKDESEGRGKGFINEMLKPELFEIRKVLQAYTDAMTIEGAEDADACGLGFSTESEWNLVLRVKTKSGSTKMVKIDRFD